MDRREGEAGRCGAISMPKANTLYTNCQSLTLSLFEWSVEKSEAFQGSDRDKTRAISVAERVRHRSNRRDAPAAFTQVDREEATCQYRTSGKSARFHLSGKRVYRDLQI